MKRWIIAFLLVALLCTVCCGCDSNTRNTSNNGGGQPNVSINIKACDTYEEYQSFIADEEIPADFVSYEDIQHFGEYSRFVCGSYYIYNDFSDCIYTLTDSAGYDLLLYVNKDYEDVEQTALTEAVINPADMRTLIREVDGAYDINGFRYSYVNGKLISFSWYEGDTNLCLFDNKLSEYPLDADTPIAQMLNISGKTAADMEQTVRGTAPQ